MADCCKELTAAIVLATAAHDEQIDKSGEPYILHPLRVMQAMNDNRHRTVAVLHDVLEDTYVTEQDLLEDGFSCGVVDAVVALTKKRGENYSDFIARAARNPVARVVKIADIQDNLRPSDDNGEAKERRIEKYMLALNYLKEAA